MAVQVTIYLNEADQWHHRPLHMEILNFLRQENVYAATAVHAVAGFLGRHRVFLFVHYLGNRLLTLLANVLYNTMLTEMETCFKAMRVDVLRSMTLRSNRFGIEPELTAKIFKRRYRVYEIPITYDGRGYEDGKKITWRDGIAAVWTLVKYRFTD